MNYNCSSSILNLSFLAFRDTRILTSDEAVSLFDSVAIGGNDESVGFTTTFTDAVLLYRATEDGFDAASFHRKCNGTNTLFIMKTTQNYVFGGFVHESLGGVSNTYFRDPNAFLFRLRTNGTTNFNILRSGGTYDQTSQYAFYNGGGYGPTFGAGHDLYIGTNANSTSSGRYSNLCYSYDCPGNINKNNSLMF